MSVQIKPLRWEDHSDAVSTMQCTVGQVGEPYHVFCENLMFFAYSGNREIARALSMGDAQAAAKADYETRVLSALEKRAAAEGDREIGTGQLPSYIPGFIPSDADRYYNGIVAGLMKRIAELEGAPSPQSTVDADAAGLREENSALRKIISDSASMLPNGAYIHPEASVGFMEGLPKEIGLVCSELQLQLREAKSPSSDRAASEVSANIAKIREALSYDEIACYPDFAGSVSNALDELEKLRSAAKEASNV